MPDIKDHVTSLEISKRLCDLGFEQGSQFYWVKDSMPEFDIGWRIESKTIFQMFTSKAKERLIIYSAYLASELGGCFYMVTKRE